MIHVNSVRDRCSNPFEQAKTLNLNSETETETETYKQTKKDANHNSIESVTLSFQPSSVTMDLSTITSALYLGVLFVCFISVAWKAAFPFLSNDATHSPFIIKSAFSFTSGLSLIVFFLIWAEFGDWLPNIRPVAWQVCRMSWIVSQTKSQGFYKCPARIAYHNIAPAAVLDILLRR